MKRHLNEVISIVGVLLLMAVTTLVFVAYLKPKYPATPKIDCLPTVSPPEWLGAATQTPNGINDLAASPEAQASVTPLPVSRTIDLSPNLSEKDELFVFVRRCDGTYELYTADPNSKTITTSLELQEGDLVVDIVPPASSMGHYPPQVSATPLVISATNTPVPYPIAPSSTSAKKSPAYP